MAGISRDSGSGFRWEGKSALRRRFRNDDGLGVVAVCFEGGCGSMSWPRERPATHAAAGAAARGVRGGLGDSFTRSGALIRRHRAAGATRRGLMRFLFLRFCGGALLPFVLRACCGGMCWPRERRQHEGLGGGLGDSFTRSGALIRRRRAAGATRRGLMRFLFLRFCGGALLPFVLRACCGGMCWPRERPATHAAAGAAARGVRGGMGGFFCGWTGSRCGSMG